MRIRTLAHEKVSRIRLNQHYLNQLKSIEEKSEVPNRSLSKIQIQQIKEYYGRFGFNSIKTNWHNFIYRVTDQFSPDYLPEDFFHAVLEKNYNNERFMYSWEDKAFMPFILNDVKFPTTICSNVNGYFFDRNNNMITRQKAKGLILNYETAFAKPTLKSGGGKGAVLVNQDNVDEVFAKLGQQFIVQEKIVQSNETAVLNPSSVNTIKLVSLLFKGEVYILSAIVRVGAPDAITDAAGTGLGYFFGIGKNGLVENAGMNLYGKPREVDYYGNPIKGRTITHYNEICDIVKRAHKRFPYFGFMSWDFCVDENDQVILIEYNTGYPIALVYQLVNGPFLSEITDMVLDDVSKRIKR